MNRSRKFQLAILTFGHMLVDMYGGFFAPLIPALGRHMGISLGRLAILAGIGGVVVNGIQPLAGLVVHRLRRPYLLILGPALALLVTCIGMANSLLVLGILVLGSRAGVGMFHPDGLMRAHAVSGDEEQVGVPIFLSGGFFGYSLGALVSTWWVAGFGFDTFVLLAIPGIMLLILYPVSGLMNADEHAANMSREHEVDEDAPCFWLLLALGGSVAMTSAVLYTFFTTHLDMIFGRDGLVLGGRTLFLMGLASALSSYMWGRLSKRVDAFAIVALAQFAAIPVFVCLLMSRSAPGIMLLGIALGPLIGGVYPLIATMARHSRGLTHGMRSGLIVGGCWLIASLPVSLCGWLVDHGVRVRPLLLGCTLPLATAGGLAAWMYLARKRKKQDTPA